MSRREKQSLTPVPTDGLRTKAVVTVKEPDAGHDFADRVISMIESECALLGFLYDHPNCIRDEFANAEEESAYEELKLSHDNDFCRVRERLREIKGDPYALSC